jgi:transposase
MDNNNKSNKKQLNNEITDEGFSILNQNAAGIDIGATEQWVCIPANRCEDNIRKFDAFTCDLLEIANWLKDNNITTVAMESTGVYWIPLFQILETRGFDVCLVNARHFKNIPGRKKTDCLDCQWLQKLHSFGLLSPSFRPDDQICRIRSILRHRQNLIRKNSKNVLHMQKALEQMNIKIHHVIDDITGLTGTKIVQEILDGERDPLKLAQLKHFRIKASLEDIIKSLEGDYRSEHLFALKQSFDSYNFGKSQILECDIEVEKMLLKIEKTDKQATFDFIEEENQIKRKKKSKPKRNAPSYDANSYLKNITGVDLTEIPGIQELTAQTIIFEIGLDMSKWDSSKHISSWLGLAPNPQKSGGKVIKQHTKKVSNRAANALRMGASSLKSSKTYLGAFFRKILFRSGRAVAITATARKLLVIIYNMLKNKTPYRELGEEYLLQKNKQRTINRLSNQAKKLGFSLVPSDS